MKLTQKRLARPSLGGILATRQGTLLLALICALAAGAVLVFAVGRYKQAAQATVQPDTVLVATGQIQKGMTGTEISAEKLYKLAPVTPTQVSPGALTDAGVLPGKVAAIAILPGQQLTATDFTVQTGVSGELAPNERAISISIDEAHGDTDVVQAGDRVDVYGSLTVDGKPVIGLLVPGALVLKPAVASATGSGAAATGSSASASPSGGDVVLVVTNNEVPLIEYAVDNAKLWLILRPSNATNPRPGLTGLASIVAANQISSTSASAPGAVGSKKVGH